jgi:pimeloyl-ACP methyl ester carboxylesterase
VTQVVEVDDRKRRLAVEISGKPDGTPVFLLHGTPGSRYGPLPRGIVLYRLGVRLISYDRPGYGGSGARPGRDVVDTASDVAAIADFLKLDRFSVVGRSGGAPHALACAAVLGDRVYCAAALSTLAPFDAEGLNWYDGMADSNKGAYRDAKADEDLTAELAKRARQVKNDPDSLLRSLWPELVKHDREVLGDAALRRILADTYAKALQDSPSGWIDDVLGLRRAWGFELSSITRPVLLWHGDNDVFSPASHAIWLAAQIKNSRLEVQPDAAHFSAVEILPTILNWIVSSAEAERLAEERLAEEQLAEERPLPVLASGR